MDDAWRLVQVADGKYWEPSQRLRFKRKVVEGAEASVGGRPHMILQQEWVCRADGSRKWDDVPVAAEGSE